MVVSSHSVLPSLSLSLSLSPRLYITVVADNIHIYTIEDIELFEESVQFDPWRSVRGDLRRAADSFKRVDQAKSG